MASAFWLLRFGRFVGTSRPAVSFKHALGVQVGGERKLLSAWVYQGCPEIWQLEEEELGEPEL